MLLRTQTPMKNNFQQHVSSIRPLKNKLLTDEKDIFNNDICGISFDQFNWINRTEFTGEALL